MTYFEVLIAFLPWVAFIVAGLAVGLRSVLLKGN